MVVDRRFLFRMKMAANIAASPDREARIRALPSTEKAVVQALIGAVDRGLKPKV